MRELKRRLRTLEQMPALHEDTRPLSIAYVLYSPGQPEHGKRIVAYEREPGERTYRRAWRVK